MTNTKPPLNALRSFLPQSMMAWIGIGLLVSIVFCLLYPVLFDNHERRFRHTKELANLRTISQAMFAYAADHDGVLPEHVDVLQDPQSGYLVDHDDMRLFTSPFFENGELRLRSVDEPTPTDWYMYGHYCFYPTAELNLESISNHSDLILIHGPSQGDPPQRPVVFFDGSASWVPNEEFNRLKANQPDVVVQEQP